MCNDNIRNYNNRISKFRWFGISYNIFNDTITALFNKHFSLRRKSRKSGKDKRWITKGLKKSSRINKVK